MIQKLSVLRFLSIGLCVVALVVGCQNGDEKPVLIKKQTSPAAYEGSESCKSCHKQEYDKWEGSHHYHSMENPTDESVLANWNTTFDEDGMMHTFFKENGVFKVELKDN